MPEKLIFLTSLILSQKHELTVLCILTFSSILLMSIQMRSVKVINLSSKHTDHNTKNIFLASYNVIFQRLTYII